MSQQQFILGGLRASHEQLVPGGGLAGDSGSVQMLASGGPGAIEVARGLPGGRINTLGALK